MAGITKADWDRIKLEHNQLLHDFMDRELTGFVEPQRKGITRGEKIGFSRKKTIAAILRGVTTFNLRHIGDAIETTASYIRYWNTESAFKNEAGEMRKKFKAYLQAQIAELRRQEETQQYEPLNLNILLEDKTIYHSDILGDIETIKQTMAGDPAHPKIFTDIEKTHKKELRLMFEPMDKSIIKNEFTKLDKLTKDFDKKQTFLRHYHDMVEDLKRKK